MRLNVGSSSDDRLAVPIATAMTTDEIFCMRDISATRLLLADDVDDSSCELFALAWILSGSETVGEHAQRLLSSNGGNPLRGEREELGELRGAGRRHRARHVEFDCGFGGIPDHQRQIVISGVFVMGEESGHDIPAFGNRNTLK